MSFIATDRSHPYVAIYGVGETEEETLADAERGADAALCLAILERGGGPGDVSWCVVDGRAVLRS